MLETLPTGVVDPSDKLTAESRLKLATWRGSQSEFRGGKAALWFSSLNLTNVVAFAQSESDGNCDLSVVYRA